MQPFKVHDTKLRKVQCKLSIFFTKVVLGAEVNPNSWQISNKNTDPNKTRHVVLNELKDENYGRYNWFSRVTSRWEDKANGSHP